MAVPESHECLAIQKPTNEDGARQCELRSRDASGRTTMRAVVIHAPRDLRIDQFPHPAPGANEVRVKVASGGIGGSDLHYYHHGGFGTVRIREPMALGHEVAGVVAAVGEGGTHLSPGAR